MSDSFEQKVNEATSKMVQSPEGKWDFPDDLELAPEVRFAANLERRRRDTQTAFARESQRAKALEVENAELASGWESDRSLSLTAEQREELDELKHSDPDAWRSKLNELEQENRSKFKETKEQISKKASQESELDRRTRLLAEFSEANPDLVLTDEVISNEIPPKYLKKLESGGSFEEFLDDCKSYLGKQKVLGGGIQAPSEPNLASSGGNSTPTDTAVETEARVSYNSEVY